MAEGQPRAASRDPLTTLGGMLESLVQRAMAVWSLVIGRRVFAVLASLALLLQVLTPPGFMVSSDPAVRGLVVCTGHGPLVVSPQPGKPAKAPRSTTPGPCVFAAHAATPPPIATLVPTAEPNAGSGASGAVFDLAPGCGLAAPPPPSQAPPLTSI